jgi:hypothetical protein
MNKLISIVPIFVAAVFLLINALDLSGSQAFGCNNSTNTNHTSGVNGTSGISTGPKPIESTGSSHISSMDISARLLDVGCCPCGPPLPLKIHGKTFTKGNIV